MKIRFNLEDDVSVFQNKNVHADFYLDSYLEVFILENNQKTLLFPQRYTVQLLLHSVDN